MTRLAIFGCGGFGREVFNVAESSMRSNGLTDPHHSGPQEIVFVADEPGGPVLGSPVITPDQLTADDRLVIAVGDPAARMAIAERLNRRFHTLIAPSAIVGPDVLIGEGSILSDQTIVTASARIGRHFHCNIYSYVAHDCVIGDFVTFAPRVSCNGNVHVGDGAYIGTGAILRQGEPGKPLVIGEGAVIGAGSVVLNDVPPNVTVVGVPARLMAA